MAFYPRGPDYLPYLPRSTVDGWDLSSSRPLGGYHHRRPLSTPGRRGDGPLLDRDYGPLGFPGRREGPLLDREYGDYRLCRRTEPGSLLYPRPPSPGYTRRHAMELEGELKVYRDELSRRDRLIGELRGGNLLDMPSTEGHAEMCSVCSHGGSLNTSKQEIEALQTNVDSLQKQVKEMEILLQSKDRKIQELKHARKTGKHKEQVKMKSESERSKSSSSSESESESGRSDTVQDKDSKNMESVSPNPESQLRELRDECMRLQKGNNDAASENGKLSQENALLKQELSKAKADFAKLETEQQSRLNCITEERDAVFGKQRHVESEVAVLQGKLDKSQHELSVARGELEQHMVHCGGLDRERRHQESVAASIEKQFASFKDSLARILSGGVLDVEPTETRIRQRIEELMTATQEKTLLIQSLERRVDEFSNKLEDEFGVLKRNHVHSDIAELRARLKHAEDELMARDEGGREFHMDREKHWQFLTRLCVVLETDPVTANLGLDEAMLTILSRVEEIMKRDIHSLSKAKNHNAHLQQQLSCLADQLESKESHLELQRRKIASLEDQLNMSAGIEHERTELMQENEFAKNRKMRKLIEKYRQELNECHTQIRALKARLIYTTDIPTRAVVEDREFVNLENEVDELENERLWQANRIAGLERGLNSASEHIVERKEVANNTIHALSMELRTTKTELQEVAKRESKLLELRLIIARMLGLDVTTLAVPDYEIISRLEKLIIANQANCTTAVALDDAISGLDKNFQMGYRHGNFAGPKLHRRSRSLSPRRRFNRKAF